MDVEPPSNKKVRRQAVTTDDINRDFPELFEEPKSEEQQEPSTPIGEQIAGTHLLLADQIREEASGYASMLAGMAAKGGFQDPSLIEKDYLEYEKLLNTSDRAEISRRAKARSQKEGIHVEEARAKEVYKFFIDGSSDKKAAMYLSLAHKVRGPESRADKIKGGWADLTRGGVSILFTGVERAVDAVVPGAGGNMTVGRIFGKKYDATYSALKQKYPLQSEDWITGRAVKSAAWGGKTKRFELKPSLI
jgi:hypothetical protein